MPEVANIEHEDYRGMRIYRRVGGQPGNWNLLGYSIYEEPGFKQLADSDMTGTYESRDAAREAVTSAAMAWIDNYLKSSGLPE